MGAFGREYAGSSPGYIACGTDGDRRWEGGISATGSGGRILLFLSCCGGVPPWLSGGFPTVVRQRFSCMSDGPGCCVILLGKCRIFRRSIRNGLTDILYMGILSVKSTKTGLCGGMEKKSGRGA